VQTLRQGHDRRALVQGKIALSLVRGTAHGRDSAAHRTKGAARLPVRQWVLSVPFPVRRLLAADARLFGAVVKVFARVVERFYLDRARAAGIASPKTGMLSFQQRFGGSLNSHCHNHPIAIDGVFALDPDSCKPRFHFLRHPRARISSASPLWSACASTRC